MAKFGKKPNFFENCSTLGMLGFQQKRIDPLNSDKVIQAVSDVLHDRERQKNGKIGRKMLFKKIGFTIYACWVP